MVTDSIIDLSGQILIDANTGNAYNIDDVDVSQFTDVFIVNTSDNPFQNYQPVTLKLIDADEQIDQPTVLQEVSVHVQNNKEPDVDTSAVLGKCDVITEQVQVQEDKRDLMTPAEEKDAEKSNITKPDDVGKSDVSEIERKSEKKTNSSDSYDSETEDTTADSSGITDNLTITDNRDVQERPESPTDNLTTTDKHDVPRKA